MYSDNLFTSVGFTCKEQLPCEYSIICNDMIMRDVCLPHSEDNEQINRTIAFIFPKKYFWVMV